MATGKHGQILLAASLSREVEFANLGLTLMHISLLIKSLNSNVGWETSFPVSVAFAPAPLPSKQTAQAAAEHKQEVKSLSLKFS